jgi:hypothetical protein
MLLYCVAYTAFKIGPREFRFLLVFFLIQLFPLIWTIKVHNSSPMDQTAMATRIRAYRVRHSTDLS